MDSEDRSLALGIVLNSQLIPNSCRMQYHENVKLSTRDREEYTGHEKLWVFIVAANPRSKKSSTAPRLLLRADQPFSLVFFSFLVEFHRNRGIEWKGILYAAYPVLQQSPTTHSATILTHTIACSHIFFSETKHCYSPSDVRSQLLPFSAIPRSWTWKCPKL